jgi:Protein of unknown function (DUF3592)
MQLTRWKIYLWLGWTGFTTGISFLLLTIGFAAYESWFLAHSLKAQGIVIANLSNQSQADAQGGTTTQTTYCPQFRYQTPDGTSYVETSSACSNPPSFAVGETLAVNYLKSNHAHAQTDSFGAKWGLVLGFSIAALVMTPFGLFFFSRLRKQGHSLDLTSFWY